jgi:hypothetical protein
LAATLGSLVGEIVEGGVVLGPQQCQMVDDELELRMMLGDPIDLRQEARRRHHDRQPGAFGFAPDPSCRIVEPGPRFRRVRGHTEPEHAPLIAPVGERVRGRRQPAHHGKAVGMELRGGKRQIVAIALPGRRHEDRPRHSGRVHLPQQIVLRERPRPVRCTAPHGPRPIRRLGTPDMNLRIDDEHERTRPSDEAA